MAIVLAVVANRQRMRAEASEAEALRAAADSEFRRLATAAAAAPTRLDALALSVAGLEQADRAGRPELDAIGPVLAALGAGDLPLIRLEGRSPDEFMAGEHQGFDVSADGSTLALVANNGDVEVWDVGQLQRRLLVPAREQAGAAAQVGLATDGSQLVVVSLESPFSGSGELVDAAVTVFDTSGDRAIERLTGTLSVFSAAAVGFGPDPGVIVIGEGDGTVVVARHDGSGFRMTRLGVETERGRSSDAAIEFSIDGTRACSIVDGARRVLQVFQIDPPAVAVGLAFEPGGGNVACLPEECAGVPQSFRATDRDGTLHCYRPDGSIAEEAGPAPLPAQSLSFSVAEGVVVEEFGSSWSISPLDGDESGVESRGVAAAISEQWEAVPLTSARVVGTMPDVRVVTTDRDGVVGVWPIQVGLPSSAAAEPSLQRDERLLPVSGPPAAAGYTLATRDLGGEPGLRLLAAGTGSEVTRFEQAPPGPSVELSPVVDAGMIGDNTLVAVGADGWVLAHDLRSAVTSPRPPLPLETELAPGDIDIGGGRVAFLAGGEVVVVDPMNAKVVDRFDTAGSSCDSSYPFPGEASFLDLGDSGAELAVVTCAGNSGRGELQIARGIGIGLEQEAVELPYAYPSWVSISEGARVTVISSFRGQIAVRHGDAWIEPAELQSERFGGVGYQQGWAMTDPTGGVVLTRRDLRGVELWTIDGNQVDRVVQVSDTFQSYFPVHARLAASGASLGWDDGTTTTWAFDRRSLVEQACRSLPTSLPEYTVAAGVTTVPCQT